MANPQDLTISLNRVSGDSETDTEFGLDVRAYAGLPSSFPSQIDVSELVWTMTNLYSDSSIATWQRVTANLPLPVNTDFLVIRLWAKENVLNDASGTEFSGHYADAVDLAIIPEPSTALLLLAAGLFSLCRRRPAVKALAILGIAGLSSPLRAETSAFTDGTFSDAYWPAPAIFYSGGCTGSTSGLQVPSGGTPGEYRQVSITLDSGPAGGLWGFHPFRYAIYDPQVQGALTAVDYSQSARSFDAPAGHNTGPAIRQNEQVYVSTGLFVYNGGWGPQSFSGLTAADFRLLDGTGHPDFSAQAAPLEFGFATGRSTPSAHGTSTVDIGVDNFRVAVHHVNFSPF